MNKKIFGALINIIYPFVCIYPIFIFIWDFFNIANLKTLYYSELIEMVGFTIKESVYSTIVALCISIIPAYYCAYSNGKLSKILKSLVVIPFAFSVISAVTIFSVIFSMEQLKFFNLRESLIAIVIVHVFYNSPIFVKYISEGLQKIPREIIESMRIEGATEIQIFLKGELPLLLPYLIKSATLVFTYCFVSFGVILGFGGIKFNTIEVEISRAFMNDNFSYALFLGGIQFFILIIFNLISSYVKEYDTSNLNIEKKLPSYLKISAIVYLLFEYGAIFIGIFYSFIDKLTGKFSIKGYTNLLSKEFNEEYMILDGVRNSIFISVIAGIFASLIVYLLIKHYNKLVDLFIFSNMGISGAFLAVTLYYMNIIYNISLTLLLIIGYIILTVPIGYSYMYPYIKCFPKEILENAKLDCKNSIERFIYVEFPMLKNIFLSTFLQIFAITFGEFTIPYTMQLEDAIPVASIVNYSLLVNKKYLESTAFSNIILLIVFTTFIIGEYIKEKE